MAKFCTVIKGSYLLKHLQQFCHEYSISTSVSQRIKNFLQYCDPKLAAMTSQKTTFWNKFALSNFLFNKYLSRTGHTTNF